MFRRQYIFKVLDASSTWQEFIVSKSTVTEEFYLGRVGQRSMGGEVRGRKGVGCVGVCLHCESGRQAVVLLCGDCGRGDDRVVEVQLCSLRLDTEAVHLCVITLVIIV